MSANIHPQDAACCMEEHCIWHGMAQDLASGRRCPECDSEHVDIERVGDIAPHFDPLLAHRHPEYEDSPLDTMGAPNSVLQATVAELISEIDELTVSNSIWLGTFIKDGVQVQCQLVVTRDELDFIDEN